MRMDERERQRLKAEARVDLTAEIVRHLETRMAEAQWRGDHNAVWAVGRWLTIFDGYLSEERQTLPGSA